ncbi:MAG: hypothetical protein J0I20_02170 [Chloroflexi bacterium]|mgnify:CR=1 FL=1|nr:hypothetical protein [Chloroflexota bacterium]OJV89424.1 MAG: hypothetical protein BGO39_36210 [Chloroflexi bacterium 54-19]
MNNGLNLSLRVVGLLLGLLLAGLAIGFVFQISWVIAIWPWPDTRYSYLFVGSILAAVTVALVWISGSGEWGAIPAGALNVAVIAFTWAIYFLQSSLAGTQTNLLYYSLFFFAGGLLSVIIFFWGRKFPLRNDRPTPRFVLISFGLFTVVLLVAGTALILRVPTIFPWPLQPDSSVLFGLIFLGDAFYFFYGLVVRRWHNAFGQLLSFLVYDLVLIGPFVGLFSSVKPEHMVSLVIYIAVLLYSGLLATYYLVFNRPKR